MFPRYYTHCDVFGRFKSPTTQWCVTNMIMLWKQLPFQGWKELPFVVKVSIQLFVHDPLAMNAIRTKEKMPCGTNLRGIAKY